MKLDLTRYAPPGIYLRQETRLYATGMVCAALYSLGFLLRYGNAYEQLYSTRAGVRMLIPGRVMEDFVVLLGRGLAGFLVLGLGMMALIGYHYAYYRQGSKSIYLMRRLPDGGLLHRQCLTLPLAGIALCLISALLLLIFYYFLYITVTPEACLVGGQWQKIWSVLL